MFELIAGFAIFRVTLLLTEEDGPYGILDDLRSQFYNKKGNPNGVIGDMLDCFWCTSLWVAIPFAALLCPPGFAYFLLYWFGLSGLAIAIHKLTDN